MKDWSNDKNHNNDTVIVNNLKQQHVVLTVLDFGETPMLWTFFSCDLKSTDKCNYECDVEPLRHSLYDQI